MSPDDKQDWILNHPENENDLGRHVVSGDRIVCRVYVHGDSRRFEKVISTGGKPASAIRVSVGFTGVDRVGRILAFIDPVSGKPVVRMGMFDVGTDRRGHEVDTQLVWDGDAPIIDVGGKNK